MQNSLQIQECLKLAGHILFQIHGLFDQGVLSLARECAVEQKLDDQKLDQHQFASYEIALVSAELLAAETALHHANVQTAKLDAQLALIFACDAISLMLSKLEGVFLDLGHDTKGIHAMLCSKDLMQLRKACTSSSALAAIGREVTASHVDIGQVDLDEAHCLARDSFRRFAADFVAPLSQEIHRHDLTVPETLLQPMREMGVFGLSIPEHYGGSAPSDREDTLVMIAVTEALSEVSLGAAGSLITRPEILARALLAGGTDLQKLVWLPQIASGSPLCAIAITEPDFGSDVANLALKASPIEGGFLLNGAKTWCTFAGKAGLLMVVARTNPDRDLGHRGLSVFLVEKPSHEGHEFNCIQENGGRLQGRAIPTIGYRGMHSFDLVFNDYFVPSANLIGESAGLGKGFYFTMAGMVGGRIQTAARASGVMRAALGAAVSYASERKVFGSALADFPLTQVKIARMASRFAACRQLVYQVGRLLDQGQGRMQASLVKLLACRSAELVTREALQLHGGMGYAEETLVSRYFVDARVLSIFEGAEETLALKVIAKSLLETALGKV